MSLDPLLVADLSHALNGEADACVTVGEVGYGSSRVLTFDGGLPDSKDVPGLYVLFSKGGRRYVANFALYSGRELGAVLPTEGGGS